MKKLLSTLLTLCLLISTLISVLPAVPAYALNAMDYGIGMMIGNSRAYADREFVEFDVLPTIVDGRTLVPARVIAESCGASVKWSDEERTVFVELGEHEVLFTIDSDVMIANGAPEPLEVPAQIIDGRTMIPLRAMAESIGQNVYWDDRGLILITELPLSAEKNSFLIESVYNCLQTGEEPSFIQSSSVLSPNVIKDAFGPKTVIFDISSQYGAGAQEQYGSKALYYLCLAVNLDPATTNEDGTLASDAAADSIRMLVSGGREPFCANGPYPAHADITNALALAKHTPEIWSQLTDDEIAKVDLLMKSFAISSNWGYNDCNDYKTGLSLMGNFDKLWNPNYRCAGLIPIMNCVIYFGSADEVNEIFTSFDYDTYMDELLDAKFTNIRTTWAKTGKDAMENGGDAPYLNGGTGAGVKQEFVYNGMPLSDIEGIFEDLVKCAYNGTVASSFGAKGTKAYAYVLDGAVSPYEGRQGMMFEFNSMDAMGMRSDANYCVMSAGNIIPFLNNLKILRGWDGSTKQQKECEELIYVGTEDLIFKLQHGYRSYSKGIGIDGYENGHYSGGYGFFKDIWRNVLGYEAE